MKKTIFFASILVFFTFTAEKPWEEPPPLIPITITVLDSTSFIAETSFTGYQQDWLVTQIRGNKAYKLSGTTAILMEGLSPGDNYFIEVTLFKGNRVIAFGFTTVNLTN